MDDAQHGRPHRLLMALALIAMVVALPGQQHAQPLHQSQQQQANAPEGPAEHQHEQGARDASAGRQPDNLWQAKQDAENPGLFSGIRITDWLLVVVGGLQLALIFWQAKVANDQKRVSERQTAISDRQAETTVRQLALTEQLERPLVLVDGIGTPGRRGYRSVEGVPALQLGAVHVANHGRGVAIMERCQIGVIVSTMPPEREVAPDGTIRVRCHTEAGGTKLVFYTSHYVQGALGPGEKWDFPLGEALLPEGTMPDGGRPLAKLWVDGTIRYRDSSGRERMTELRQIYDFNAIFFMPDPAAPEFNRFT